MNFDQDGAYGSVKDSDITVKERFVMMEVLLAGMQMKDGYGLTLPFPIPLPVALAIARGVLSKLP